MALFYIVISIFALLVLLALALGAIYRQPRQLSGLASLAIGFGAAGIYFGENRWIGYLFLGIGLLLALIDINNSFKSRKPGQEFPAE